MGKYCTWWAPLFPMRRISCWFPAPPAQAARSWRGSPTRRWKPKKAKNLVYSRKHFSKNIFYHFQLIFWGDVEEPAPFESISAFRSEEFVQWSPALGKSLPLSLVLRSGVSRLKWNMNEKIFEIKFSNSFPHTFAKLTSSLTILDPAASSSAVIREGKGRACGRNSFVKRKKKVFLSVVLCVGNSFLFHQRHFVCVRHPQATVQDLPVE